MFTSTRSILTLAAFAACGIAVSSQASAAGLDTRLYVTPSANYTWTDSQLHAKDDFGYGIGIGKAVNETVNLELNANHNEYDHNSGFSGKVRDTGVMVDALYFLSRNPGLSPYAVLGIGGVRSHTSGDTSTNFAANAGLGVMTWISAGVALRADARYRYIDDKNFSRNEGLVNVGLVIPFGAAR
jgi:OOP family OmpA-OmpF porin